MSSPFNRIETLLIHAGEPEPPIQGAVITPIFQSSTFQATEGQSYHDIRYIRLNNTPNHIALHKKLAALEGGEDAVVTASGMAIISTTFLALLKPGDHFLAQDCLYGGTHDLITKDLSALGIAVDFIDGDAPETWPEKLRDTTRLIYMESIANPLMRVADLKAAAEFASAHGLISIIDNTFASPVNLRPLEMGFDIALHSATKYLNGHSDIVAGAAVGSQSLIQAVKHKLDHFGASLDPHACFLFDRGLKTLAVRMRYQNESALRFARFLSEHAAVESVFYPGLPGNPGYERAREWFDGFGGMLAFETRGGLDAARRCMARLRIPFVAPSLGGVESLVTRPATTSHAGMSPEDRAKSGISDSLIRLSVGLEATEDLMDDFDQALGG